jgi:para-nitrobenzyl esterase
MELGLKVFGIALAAVLLLALSGSALVWINLSALTPEASDEVVIADVGSERLTPSGSIVGFAGPNESHAWLGVPYAQPPVGALRWRAPRRVEPWTDTLDALAYPTPCAQLASPVGGIEDAEPGTPVGDEDCLFVNIWSPRFDEESVPSGSERLPVMVWIHGGGNTVGAAGDLYDGSLLATTHRVIVVSLGYRLGPLGWFAHPALATGGERSADRSANYGMLDLIEGLRWVRENIEYFGGDPHNVTIFGESAGGKNVLGLMVSPHARGLFARGIVQSGSTQSVGLARARDYSDAQTQEGMAGHPFSAREIVVRLLMDDGSAPDRAAARLFAEGLGDEQTAEYLRSKSPEALFAAYLEDETATRVRMPTVIRDGDVIPESGILEALDRVEVPVMIGTNRDESRLFFAFDPAYVTRHFQIFVRVADPERYLKASGFHSDLWRVRGVEEPLTLLGGRPQAGTFAYRFDWDEEPRILGADLSMILGAGHGLEIPFVFGHFRLGKSALAQLLFDEDNWPGRKFVSDAMMSYWAQFAYTGDPGRGRAGALPLWPAWRPGAEGEFGQFVIFDTPKAGGIRLSHEAMTRAELRAEIEADTVLNQVERCRLFFELMRDVGQFDEAAYQASDAGRCAEYPSERYGPY